MWDLAVESDPATLTWIKETHAAEQDISTMSETVAPEAGIVPENDESKDVLPENVGTKPISSTANLAGLETTRNRHCKSRTPGTANLAPLALQMPQGCYIRIKPSMKTLHVNHSSLPSGELPASGKRPAGKDGGNDSIGASEVVAVISHLASVRSKLSLTTAEPTKRDLDRTGRLIARIAEANGNDHPAALALILAVIDWLPANTYWLGRIDSARRLAGNWDAIVNDWTISQLERQRERDAAARNRDRRPSSKPTPVPDRHSDRHVHSFMCEHVLTDMKPHEAEYDHEGSLRNGHPSDWQAACMRHADELNKRDGIEVAA